MAANEFDSGIEHSPHGEKSRAMAREVHERLEEEVARAERHGNGLSCLLMVFENLEEIKREHGEELAEQVIEYVAEALRADLRPFDRVCRASERELVVITPGADGTDGEIVARRALERMRAIKIEAGGSRLPLHVSVALAAWRIEMSAQALMERARAALERLDGENGVAGRESGQTPVSEEPGTGEESHAGEGRRAAGGEAASQSPASPAAGRRTAQ